MSVGREIRKSLPRERLFREGPSSLSDRDLVALFVRTGLRGKGVLGLADELLARSGGIRGLFEMEANELRAIPGLGDAKIAELKAIYELAKRYLQEKIQGRDLLASPHQVREYFQFSLQGSTTETFQVVLLDCHHHVIRIQTVAQGNPHSVEISIREIMREALVHGAASLIFVHNHPYGEAAPSEHDIQTTEEIMSVAWKLGIRVVEHLIIGQKGSYSFCEAGRLEALEARLAQG